MKNRRVFAILLSVLMVVALLPATAFADLSDWGEFDTESPTTFNVTKKDIDDYSQLEELVTADGIETIVIKTNINTSDLSKFQKLGHTIQEGGVAFDDVRVPRIQATSKDIASGRPVQKLPKYDPDAIIDEAFHPSKFDSGYTLKVNDAHSIMQNFWWVTDVTYIYDGSSNTVRIDHQVEDADGTLMLQYASQRPNSKVSKDGQYVKISGIDSPDFTRTLYNAYYQYNGAVWAFTTLNNQQSSPFALFLSYRYALDATFLSAVNIDLPYVTLGSVEITKEDPDNKPLAGAEFKIYEYDENAQGTIGAEAKRFDPDSKTWVDVGTVTTGADGKVTVVGLATGSYHVIETKAPNGCMINESDKDHIVFISGANGTHKLDFEGGEGTQVTINKQETYFEPNWEGNAAAPDPEDPSGKTFLPIDLLTPDGVVNTESKTANSYGMDVFFRGKKDANDNPGLVTFSNATIAQTIDESALNTPTYTLKVGNIEKTFTKLTGDDENTCLLAYINKELIGNDVIDSADARAMVTVTANVDAVYIPNNNTVAKTTFTNEYIPYEVTVNKSWINDTPAQRGEYLDVQLLQDGKAYGDPVRLTEAEKWTYTWKNLPGNHTYKVAEPVVPENYVMGSQTTEDPGATVIKITVDITNTYVPSAAETFDNSKILIIVSCTMVLAVCFLALKMRKTASK